MYVFVNNNKLILSSYITFICHVAICQSIHNQITPTHKNSDIAKINDMLDKGDYYIDRNVDSAAYYYRQAYLLSTSKYKDSNNQIFRKMLGLSLNGIGHAYVSSDNPDSALALFHQAIDIADQIDDNTLLASSLNYIGMYYYGSGHYDSAEHYVTKAMEIRRSLGDDRLLANSMNNLAWLVHERGDRTRAISLLKEAVERWEVVHDSSGMAYGLHGLGAITYQLGRFAESLDYHIRSLSIRESLSETRGMSVSHNEIATILKEAGELESALEHHLSSIHLMKELNDMAQLGIAHNNVAHIYVEMGRYSEAIESLNEAIKLCTTVDHKTGLAIALMNRGRVEFRIGNMDDAEQWLHESLLLYRQMNNQHGIAQCLVGLGEAYISLSRDTEGIKALNESVRIARNIGSKRVESNALKLLHSIYRGRGESHQAYAAMARMLSLEDSLAIREAALSVVRFDLRQEQVMTSTKDSLERAITAQQAKAALRLSHEINDLQLERTRVVGIIVLGVMLIAGYLAWLKANRSSIARTRMKNALTSRIWRSQINPHFIHTALQNINNYVQANERDRASAFLTRFARLMRAVLEHARKDEVSLAEDLSVLRDYLDLERLRSGARFEYRLEVGSDIDPEDLMVPPMLLQPYAEQAIWNSMGRTDGPGHLVIRVQRSQGTLVLILEDDLQSRATDQSIASDRSEGTDITEARLALLAKQGKRQASVKVIPMPVGRRVELTLPLSEAA